MEAGTLGFFEEVAPNKNNNNNNKGNKLSSDMRSVRV